MRQGATSLGDFETLLLLAILHLSEGDHEAYGSAIRREIEARAGRDVSRGSIYVGLDRLEAKGFLVSRHVEGTPARSGRPKRLFTVTPAGLRAVRDSVSAVVRMQRGLGAVLGRV
jgi:DNA-binding PadR family transcriptional regulator